jgi:GNAT superfamily N-acetyltransferase
MDSIRVRQAVFADLAELARLFDDYRRFQGKASDLPAAMAFLQERFNHGESVVYMAHEAGAPMGFAQLYPSFSSTALKRVFILNDLFVADGGRRKGVASMLLAAVEAHAFALGACRLSLNVARNNPQAQALYEARGWTRDAEHHMYHRFGASP